MTCPARLVVYFPSRQSVDFNYRMTREIPISNEPAGSPGDPVEEIIRYHIQTKHHLYRYARSLGYLDWANQPNPFRRYEGAPLLELPLLGPEEEPASPDYQRIYEGRAIPGRPVGRPTLSRFFELALGLTAWKRAGDTEWALRSNPSSGNLHPTEGYVVLPELPHAVLEPGLYHYAPKEHGLELRARFSAARLAALLAPFPPGAFLFGLTSVHWREAWKYGERAFRYCHHDVGHAIGAARISAATLGWGMVLLDGADYRTIALLLGTSREEDFLPQEQEHPDCLAVVWPFDTNGGAPDGRQTCRDLPLSLDHETVRALVEGTWHGRANRLSREHAVHWDIIDRAAHASRKPNADRMAIPHFERFAADAAPPPNVGIAATTIIHQRRSAVAFDGATSITAATFFGMLQRINPGADQPVCRRSMPWDVWPYEPAIHLLLFVHRVDGLTPGLYCLVRDRKKLSLLQRSMNPEINWVPAPECPPNLPLYWLLEGDPRQLAVQISCHQDIAGDGAFSLGMLAEFEGPLRERGAWWYPRLFWESGLIGQVLYLEAEAAGVRATGIGCFFDDPVHEIVALRDLSFQSLYHFTVGGPVEDRRLTTLPAYAHIRRNTSERTKDTRTDVQDQEEAGQAKTHHSV